MKLNAVPFWAAEVQKHFITKCEDSLGAKTGLQFDVHQYRGTMAVRQKMLRSLMADPITQSRSNNKQRQVGASGCKNVINPVWST